MKKAPIPMNEMDRLQALVDYKILDTPPEQGYDEITSLASYICQTPIALVSLVDGSRQWFKSHHGVEATETPRDISFCGHAIHGKDIFEISDSTKDARFADNPLVTGGPNVIFYAGAPLISPSGHAVGTLCVIDTHARELSVEQRNGLASLAKVVIEKMESQKQQRSLEKLFSELQSSTQKLLNYEHRLTEQGKLAVLGEMAGGLAHEINNPMAIVKSAAELLKAKVASGKADKESLEKGFTRIIGGSERVAEIVKGMRAFAKTAENDPVEITTAQTIVTMALNLIRAKIVNANIELRIGEIPKNSFECRPAQAAQALFNLILNAVQAVAPLEEKWIDLSVTATSSNMIFIVKDSGLGIAAEVAEKIFRPFFTTRAPGSGQGLGLSSAKGIVENLQGKLEYKLADGRTSFTMLLPLRQSKDLPKAG